MIKYVLVIAGILQMCASAGFAFVITDDLEQISVSGVTGSFQSVTFGQSYIDPIPVCVGQVASNANWTPVVRLQNVTSTGMEVRVQKLSNVANDTTAPTVYVGAVNCIIADAGTARFPDAPNATKVWYQAGKHVVSNTFGNNAANNWNGGQFNANEVVVDGGLNGVYAGTDLTKELGVLAQIMTSADPFGQVPHVNDCESRANQPFQSNFNDGVCIGRHIGKLGSGSTSRAPETIGYIIFRTGTGRIENSHGGFDVAGDLTSDSVRSVDNSPPYSFYTTYDLDGAVALQQAEDGGDGSYVALYGTAPLAGSQIDMALDESSNADRNHTTEVVAWLGFRSLVVPIDVQKSVSLTGTQGFQTLDYTMTVENIGVAPIALVTATDVLKRDTTTVPLTSGPTLTNPSPLGILGVGETWNYTATYNITEADYIAGGATLLNTFSVSGPTILTTSATAETVLTINPDLNVEKTSQVFGTNSIPAMGVKVGDVVEYIYTIRNDGNVPMTNLNYSDAHGGLGDPLVDGGCQLTQDQLTMGNSTTGTTPFVIDTLAARDTVVCKATYTVVQADIDQLQNQ